jgi:hypothetical protein
VIELRTAHTADLDTAARSAIRIPMDDAFGGAVDLVCDWRAGSAW